MVDLCEIYICHTCINHIIQRVSRVPVVIMVAVHQWDHLILPVSVKLATLDLPVRLTLMTVCLQPAPATAYVWMESITLNAHACLGLGKSMVLV